MDNNLIIYAILGAGNDEEGIIDSDGVQRCDLAVEMLANNKNAKLILCGGFGGHFNTTDKQHHQYLKAYIESNLNNIEQYILGYIDSYNTIGDIEGINNQLQPLNCNIRLVIITNDYHVLRASILAKKIITSEVITVHFLSVSSQKNIDTLSKRLKHEVGRINEYFTNL